MQAYNPRYKRRSFGFSSQELRDLALGWIVISFAFMFALIPGLGGFSSRVFILSAVTVGIGFLLHELAHKFVAQYYHCQAEFKSYPSMLVFALALAFFVGFVFAAPGAVMISNVRRVEQLGHIAVAGPIVNIVLAGIFFMIPGDIGRFGFMINAWLALFNMIPLGPLDGKKVRAWSKTAFWVVLGISGALTFASFYVAF